MSRKNIFEILENKWNIIDEVKRIFTLLNTDCISVGYSGDKTIIEFVDDYCFYDWKNRYSYLDIEDMAKDLDIKLDEDKIPSNLESIEILKYLEFARNLIMICDTKLFIDNEKDSDDKYKYTYYQEYTVLKENINIVLEHLNFSTKLLKKEERIILIEKNPSAMSVAEIVDEDTACKVIEYNHYLLKGDIDKKKEVLLQLANKYEGIKSNIKSLNSKLDDDIGFMLNNMHIRHNNKSGKSKKEYVSKMRKDTMEKWYDETYQMLLLAFLLNEQPSRSKKISQLKEKIK